MAEPTPKDPPRKGQPTERMIIAAVTAAARHKVALPEGYEREFDICKAFLDDFLSRPTPKAIAFAQKIAAEQGIELPPQALVSGKELSAWIDAHRSGAS